MQIYNDIKEINVNNPFVSVGTFDGVHLGHQYIFEQLIKEAKLNGGESVLVTFWPHPRTVINNVGDKILMINSIEERIELIEKFGIQHFIILPFTKEFAQLSSRAFIEKYLHEELQIKGLIVGYDHKFGKDRQGNFELLKEYAIDYGFQIKKLDVFSVNGENISSTIIRKALLDGKIERANSFLGRNFAISGHVINGKQIGRDIGFPTANIQPDFPHKIIPKDGVYAVKVLIENELFVGMLNIGIRPTIDNDNNKSIEVHIINYNGDLYGQNIKLFFHKRIRDEMKFSSVEELIQQLKKDKAGIENYFK